MNFLLRGTTCVRIERRTSTIQWGQVGQRLGTVALAKPWRAKDIPLRVGACFGIDNLLNL